MTAQSTPRQGFSQALRSPVVRIALVTLIGLIVLIVLVVIGISVLKGSRDRPINVEVYPGAALVTKSELPRSDSFVYSTGDSVQQVLNFYAERHGFSADDSDGCKKIYLTNPVSEAPGKSQGRCEISNSFLDVSQILSIKIDYVTDANGKNGKTMIAIDRNWGG